MKELMEKMAMQGRGNEMDEMPENNDIQAKLEVLRELHEMATQLLGSDMESGEGMDEMPEEDMESVLVSAKNKEGLEEGLDVAQNVLGDMSKNTGDFY